MKLSLLLTILIGGLILLTYVMIERHINQKRCLSCGLRVSTETPDKHCPRCGAKFDPQLNRNGREAA